MRHIVFKVFFHNLQQHLSEINDPLVEQAILDNIEDVYYKDDSFDSSLYELQVKIIMTTAC